MKKNYIALFVALIASSLTFAQIVRTDFNVTVNSTNTELEQLVFSQWPNSGMFTVQYFPNGAITFSGKSTAEFISSTCVKPIGNGNFHPIRIYNQSSVRTAGAEWRSTPVFIAQPNLTFENEFQNKGNQYIAARIAFKTSPDTIFMWFVVNLNEDASSFTVVKAAYEPEFNTDILTENDGSSRPTTNVLSVNNNIPLQVFPNPASGVVNISTQGNYTYEILDVNGKVCMWGNGHDLTSIETTGLNAGIYSLKVSANTGTVARKLIVN